MSFIRAACLLTGALSLSSASTDDAVGYAVADTYDTNLVKQGLKGSALYTFDVDGIAVNTTFLLDVRGDTRYDMGFDQGYLIGDKIDATISSLLNTLTDSTAVLNKIIEELLLWQWTIALSLQTPSGYVDELRGIADGADAAGYKPKSGYSCGNLTAMGVVLANLPGSADDIVYVLMKELPLVTQTRMEAEMQAAGLEEHDLAVVLHDQIHWLNPGCSNFGAWGERTAGGMLFSGRNLDWESDTGVNQNKLITVYHPPDGIAHATIGFAGIVGALTGISAAGVTVHEANLESNKDTFYGFPWTLRLRNVMEVATDIASAQALWLSANNTCGFNHAVGSAAVADEGQPRFMALETDAEHTAVFFDMDPRELNSTNGGDPRPSALYRTNHGFDPETIAHYTWNGTNANTDSMARYALFPQLFDAVPMGQYATDDAIKTVAVLGQKGDDYWQCGGPGTYGSASNVISSAFVPAVGAGVLYAAWEEGSGQHMANGGDWVPACCSTFVKVDLQKWW